MSKCAQDLEHPAISASMNELRNTRTSNSVKLIPTLNFKVSTHNEQVFIETI